MNKAILNNLLEQNRQTMVARSLRNCHARGLDSIMVYDKPGMRIRIFVATPDHELWKNRLGGIWNDKKFKKTMSVAMHPHHCDLTLRVIFGNLANFEIAKGNVQLPQQNTSSYHNFIDLKEYEYVSPISTGEKGEFICLRDVQVPSYSIRQTKIGDSFASRELEMKADEIHTVAIAKGKPCAWFVFEGDSDPNYKPVCYSNDDLESFSFDGLYEPMSEDYLDKTIQIILDNAK